jgi:hypothetical protein
MIAAALRSRVAGAIRLLTDADARSALVTRLLHREAIHQDVTLSWPDRYPRLFAEVAELLRDVARPRLLSFGCSAGEEVQSLKRLIPDARIVGLEINRAKLRSCLQLPTDPDVSFFPSTPAAVAAHGPYDAVFCMAVLTRRPHEVERKGMTNIRRLYPYTRFRDQLHILVRALQPGGLLVVEHSLYLVEHEAEALGLVTAGGVWPAKGPRFDAAGALIPGQPTIARIWRKAT